MSLFFRETLQRSVICADYSGNRSSYNRGEFSGDFVRYVRKSGSQAFVSAHYGVHISQSRAENSALALEPSRFVKPAYIAGASAGVADNDYPSQLIQHGNRARLVGSEWS